MAGSGLPWEQDGCLGFILGGRNLIPGVTIAPPPQTLWQLDGSWEQLSAAEELGSATEANLEETAVVSKEVGRPKKKFRRVGAVVEENARRNSLLKAWILFLMSI